MQANLGFPLQLMIENNQVEERVVKSGQDKSEKNKLKHKGS